MAVWMNHGDGHWWPVAWLWTLLFWALVVWLVVSLVRRAGRGGPNQGGRRPGRSAEDILAERFARGEIDEQEYRQRLDVLRAGSRSGQDRRS